jgi:hypothetical protein
MRRHHSRFRVTRLHAARVMVATTAALAAAAAVPAGLALADSSGTITETIHTGLLSVTLSTNAVDLCSSATPLTFPNGSCTSSSITITNGAVPANIEVNGADAVPSDGGTSWTLCSSGGPAPACTLPTAQGQDQFSEQTLGKFMGPILANATVNTPPQCDTAFDSSAQGCTASAGQVGNERIQLVGPSASTDPSLTFSTSVTWTAVAP